MCPPADSGDATKPEAVRAWLLGGFKVSVGPRTMVRDAWRRKKVAALVKLLVLAPGHRLHREQVMETLWPALGKNALRHQAGSVREAVSSAAALYPSTEVRVKIPIGRRSSLPQVGTRIPVRHILNSSFVQTVRRWVPGSKLLTLLFAMGCAPLEKGGRR